MRTSTPGRFTLRAAALAAAMLGAPSMAAAQEVIADGFDAHGFHLAAFDGDVRDPYSVYRPGRIHQWEFYAAMLGEYAKAPLSYVSGPVDDTTMAPVLDNLAVGNLALGLAVHERVRLDVAMPLYLFSQFDGSATGTKVGDLRVSGMVSIIRPSYEGAGGLGLGFVPWIDLPTGDDSVYLGNAGVAGGGALATTYEAEKLTLSAHVGYQYQPDVKAYNIEGADRLLAAAGIGWLFGRYAGLNFEALLAPPLSANQEKGTDFPVETILSFRKRFENGGHFTVGAGAALTDGAGAAPFRAFLGGGFGRIETPVPPDLDGDGIPNAVDQCPEHPEIVNDWADEDGCPDTLSTIAVWGQYQEEPRELTKVSLEGPDGVRLLDPEDAKVENVMPGIVYTATAVAGCLQGEVETEAIGGQTDLVIPLERQLEGSLQFEVTTLEEKEPIPGATVKIRSDQDECAPQDAMLQLGDDGTGTVALGAGDHVVIIDVPKYALYRQKVNIKPGENEQVVVSLKKTKTRVTAQRIEIFEKVHFETGKAIIKPDSYDLLNEVADAINTHKQIRLVEVAGHTDDQGTAASNMTLSQDRAQAVLDYMVGKGVSASKLQAKGYGETRTIDTNETAEGRAKNRRVEFNILEQDTVILED